MSDVKLITAASLLMMALSGCTPTVFGVPQDQWNQLTPAERSQVIQGYNQQQQTNAENAPIYAALDTANNLVMANQNNAAMPPLPPMPQPMSGY